jgi:hypothetical protein
LSLSNASPPPSNDPGWYPDPLNESRERYFDGNEWTDRIQKASAGNYEGSMGAATGAAPPPASSRNGGWWSRLPRWAQWSIGIVAALILLGIGGAIGSSGAKEGELKDEVANLEGQVKQANSAQKQAEADAAKAEEAEPAAIEAGEQHAAKIIEGAEAKADKIVKSASSEEQEISGQISAQKGELSNLEGKAESTETRISNLRGEEDEAEEVAAKSEISDGTWQAERDYIPGTYEAPGGGSCYWALLSEPGGGGIEGIIENGGFNKHQILTIDSPYFETRGCGIWERVGE